MRRVEKGKKALKEKVGRACGSFPQVESLAAKRKESGMASRESPKGALKGAKDASMGSAKDQSREPSRDSPKTSPKKGKGAHKNTERKDDPLSTEVVGEKEENKKTEDDFMDDGRRGEDA